VTSLHPVELGRDETVLFLLEAFEILCEIVTKEMSLGNASSNINNNNNLRTTAETAHGSDNNINIIGGSGDIGHLIPLHCGHNGWPGIAVKLMFLELLRKYNFNIDINKSGNKKSLS